MQTQLFLGLDIRPPNPGTINFISRELLSNIHILPFPASELGDDTARSRTELRVFGIASVRTKQAIARACETAGFVGKGPKQHGSAAGLPKGRGRSTNVEN